MSKRSIIFSVLLILFLFLFILSKLFNKPENVHNYKFKDFTFESLNSVGIKDFVIKKESDNQWRIGREICNKHKIEYIFNYIKELDFNNIISENQKDYDNFNLAEGVALKITLTFDKNNFNIWVGKPTPDGNGCYVRLDDGKVYIITKNLNFEFNRGKRYYYLETLKDNISSPNQNSSSNDNITNDNINDNITNDNSSKFPDNSSSGKS